MRPMLTAAVATMLLLLGPLTGCGSGTVSPEGDRGGGEAGGAPSCPAQWGGAGKTWVPSEAPERLGSRLVPAARPVNSVLCRYDGSNVRSFEGARLAWRATPSKQALAGALDGLAELAGGNPDKQTMCTMIAGPQRNYLLGLRYRSGAVVWVFGAVDPNGCVPTSNGRFTTTQSAKPIFARLASASTTADQRP
ncbi:MAG: hypothetical protein ACRDOY_10160 [Nocardioidaceae bacterium]